jgi:hypothetical protein
MARSTVDESEATVEGAPVMATFIAGSPSHGETPAFNPSTRATAPTCRAPRLGLSLHGSWAASRVAALGATLQSYVGTESVDRILCGVRDDRGFSVHDEVGDDGAESW